jgi:hypothetical protein
MKDTANLHGEPHIQVFPSALPPKAPATEGPAWGVQLLFGSVSSVVFPELIQELSDRGLTGDLQVIAGRAIRTVFFQAGSIVLAASNLSRDRLGQCLLERGRLTPEDLERTGPLTAEHRIGQAIVSSGLLSQKELREELTRQAKRIIGSLYELREGVYSFEERACPIPNELQLKLTVPEIQLEGIRRIKDESRITRGLGCLNLRVFPTPERAARLLGSLTSLERQVLSVAGQGRTPGEIASRVRQEDGAVLRALYGLLRAGALEGVRVWTTSPGGEHLSQEGPIRVVPHHRTSASRSRPHSLTGQSHVAQPASTADTSSETNGGGAGAAQAVGRDRFLLDPDTSVFVRFPGSDHPARWNGSDEKTSPSFAYEAEHSSGPLDQSEMELVVGGAGEEVARGGEVAPMAPIAESLSAAAANDRPEEDFLGGRSPAPSISVALTTQGRVERIRNLKASLGPGINYLEGAIAALQELVKALPDRAEHHYMLAEALAKHPARRAEARLHFRKALAIAPQETDIRYALAEYYLALHQRSRASKELENILRIEPSHGDAARLLDEISDDEEETPTLPRLFRQFF